MIYLLGGEDIVASRKKLTELIEGKSSVIRLDGKTATLAELDEAVLSGGLFSDTKTIVVERFTKLRPEVRVWEILKPAEGDKSTDVILWDEQDLSKKKFQKGSQTFNFLFPKFYYALLDSFEPRSEKSIELLNEVVKTFEAEQILYGLIRRVRQLLIMRSSRYLEFSEFKKMQSWQISKLKKQADFWTEDQLKKVYIMLAELDEKVKTSNLPMPLHYHLDMIMLSDLN